MDIQTIEIKLKIMSGNKNHNNSGGDYTSKVPLLKNRAYFKSWEIRF